MTDLCKTCNRQVDVSKLVKDKYAKKGYRSKCYECLHYSRTDRPYVPGRGRSVGGTPRNRHIPPAEKKAILDEIRNVPCLDCGGTFPVVCMDFDHVTGTKLFGIMSHYRDKTMGQLLAEVQKCEVVCANCHRVRTASRR